MRWGDRGRGWSYIVSDEMGGQREGMEVVSDEMGGQRVEVVLDEMGGQR